MRAHLIANECEYTDKEEQLLDTLIAGLHSDDVRRKLIAKDKTTTLDQALAIVQAYGGTERQMDDIQGTQQIQAVNKQCPQYRKMEKTRADLLGCYNGGKTHTKSDSDKAGDDFVLDTIETTPLAKLESIFKEGSKSQAFTNVKMKGPGTCVMQD